MKTRIFNLSLLIGTLLCGGSLFAQSIHYSQYYNAPLLVNTANTALMPDYDYRVGVNYRSQWAILPVPFTTSSFFGDFKIGAGREGDNKNWLGIGGAVFSDKAGDAELSLTQIQGSIAYHLHLSDYSMLSFGAGGGYVQRSINLDKLSFDVQWDGRTFNTRRNNGEKLGSLSTNYYTVNAGANLAFFPNAATYIYVGAGVANVNEPVETFYNNGNNQIQMRPAFNLDMIFKTSENIIINPSVFYAMQGGASEIVFGSLFRRNLAQEKGVRRSELIVGAYHRIADALIGVAGYQYGSWQLTANYDFTISALAPYNAAQGALEISLINGGNYYRNRGGNTMYGCPRFN